MKTQETKFKQTEIGPIPEEWEVLSIEQVADVVGGGTPSTKNETNFGGPIPWITPRDLSIFQGRFIEHGERNISEVGFEQSNAKLLPKGSVLLSSRAPVGYLAIAANEVTTNQGFQSLVSNAKVNNEFLYYLLQNNTQKLIDHASGSTFQELSGKTLKTITFAFPKVAEQSRIASILSSLDDKIELSRKINVNLEQIASALFKRWFVDFEFPFDQEGRPLPPEALAKGGYKSSGGKMVDSELGKIPEGWRVSSLVDVAEVLSGGTPKTAVDKYWSGDIPWFSVVDAPIVSDVYVIDTEKKITQMGLENSAATLLPEGVTIITARGTVGKVALVGSPMAMNQSCYGLHGKRQDSVYFIYFTVRLSVSALQKGSHGSVFDTITRETFAGVKIAEPTQELIKSFEDAVVPLMKMIKEHVIESSSLKILRDSLLPRLMSGRIRIS